MGRNKSLKGIRFGRLLVIEGGYKQCGRYAWLCKCDCGNITTVMTNSLTSGNTQSCGCLTIDSARERFSMHAMSNRNCPLHVTWNGMKQRCLNQNNNRFSSYGGRGITICDEWFDFKKFYDWAISNGYEQGLTLDRIDNDGNYCPENCRWATGLQQQNNMRSNTFITFNGERKTIAQWSRALKMRYGTLVTRITRGWSIERAFTTPVQTHKKG